MADLILKVTPEEVRTKANEINAQKEMMTTYLQDMKGKMTQLQDAFNSEAGQKYIEKFNQLSNSINASLEELDRHVRNLNDAAAEYDSGISKVNSLVDQLSTENIF